MEYNEEYYFNKAAGRCTANITVALSRTELVTVTNVLSMDEGTRNSFFAEKDAVTISTLDNGSHLVAVVAHPDYYHVVSDNPCYISIDITDKTRARAYNNYYFLDDRDISKLKSCKQCPLVIDCAVEVYPLPAKKYDTPILYNLSITTN